MYSNCDMEDLWNVISDVNKNQFNSFLFKFELFKIYISTVNIDHRSSI